MNDPLLQVWIVGVAISLAAAAISFYLWTEHRSERFLLFWTLGWSAGLIRWLIHYPAESNAFLRGIEGMMIPVTMFFTVLGSYDLLPNKPWKQRMIVAWTAALLLAYGVLANTLGLPIQMGYALFAAVLAFSGGCMAVAFRATRLPGYAFGTGTFLYQLVVVSVLLSEHGSEVANSIIVPLWQIPLMLSIVVIAYQRNKRTLIDSEQTLKKLYVRLANVEDDERRALHAELHDRVGANLAALRLELDVAASLLARGEAPPAERYLGSARGALAETISMARDVMAELRPPALDDYGLPAALRAFAHAQSERFDLPIDVEGAELRPRPGPEIESALFRIAQEAVVNAVRHASATRVRVSLGNRGGSVILTVEDDGAGFDPDASFASPDHWGIKNMRGRAVAVGGTLQLDTERGGGTRVTVAVPGATA
jgi:signal transduction histidine kinase